MQKLQLKPNHPTLIVDLNEDNFDTRSQSNEISLEKFNYEPDLIDHILWSDECKFNRNGIVIATIVSIGLLKILMRNLACQTQKKR